MPRTRFNAEVLTPEGQVFEGEVEMVSTRTTVGSLAVLAKHQPMLTLLEPTELRLYTGESEIQRYAQGEGYMQVTGESVLLLVEEAIPPGDLDAADLRDRLRQAEDAADRAEEGSEEERLAQRERRRWAAFLDIAEG
ncbi:MAG TPA: ATP synthase F1 subunit epsilon [Solirubrobacteraceae bacterium]|nr:ATP synthase F1 subunit epsilon [Solirubrobacteraceae bacterium]